MQAEIEELTAAKEFLTRRQDELKSEKTTALEDAASQLATEQENSKKLAEVLVPTLAPPIWTAAAAAARARAPATTVECVDVS